MTPRSPATALEAAIPPSSLGHGGEWGSVIRLHIRVVSRRQVRGARVVVGLLVPGRMWPRRRSVYRVLGQAGVGSLCVVSSLGYLPRPVVLVDLRHGDGTGTGIAISLRLR